MGDILSKLKLNTTGRVAVFIDAANILYSQKSMGWEVDYKKFSKFLRRNFNVVFLGFYLGILKENSRQKIFISILKDYKYTVRSKPVKYIKSKEGVVLKGNLDIELVLDVVEKVDEFDTCYLFSGDSDFTILVEYLRNKDKQVVVFSTKKTCWVGVNKIL